MPRLEVILYDANGQSEAFTDDDLEGKPFINLQDRGWASRAVNAVVNTFDESVRGDHALLTQAAQEDQTDTIVLDPWLVQGAVPLGSVDKGFSERACGLQFRLNNSGFPARARMVLCNSGDNINWPSLVFYDFEQPVDDNLIELQPYFFVGKTAQVRADLLTVGPGVVSPVSSAICSLLDHGASLELTCTPDQPNQFRDLQGTGWLNRASAISMSLVVSPAATPSGSGTTQPEALASAATR